MHWRDKYDFAKEEKKSVKKCIKAYLEDIACLLPLVFSLILSGKVYRTGRITNVSVGKCNDVSVHSRAATIWSAQELAHVLFGNDAICKATHVVIGSEVDQAHIRALELWIQAAP